MDCSKKCSCECNSNYICIALFVSAVIAAAVGLLLGFEVISTAVATAVYVVLGLAILNFIILVAGLFSSANNSGTPLSRCLCCYAKSLLAGIIGTIVLGIAILALPLTTISTALIILISIGTFFAVFMTIQLIVFLLCIATRLCFLRSAE